MTEAIAGRPNKERAAAKTNLNVIASPLYDGQRFKSRFQGQFAESKTRFTLLAAPTCRISKPYSALGPTWTLAIKARDRSDRKFYERMFARYPSIALELFEQIETRTTRGSWCISKATCSLLFEPPRFTARETISQMYEFAPGDRVQLNVLGLARSLNKRVTTGTVFSLIGRRCVVQVDGWSGRRAIHRSNLSR